MSGAVVSPANPREYSGTRSVARKLALQALYRWQLNAAPWQDLIQEFGEAEDMARADREYFRTLVEGVWHARDALDTRLAALGDRAPHLLDPIEHAILLMGLFELQRPAARSPTASPSTRRSASRSASAPPTGTSSSTPCWIAPPGNCARANTDRAAGTLMALTESTLIERYFRACGAQRTDVRLGIGDDAALLRVARRQRARGRRPTPWWRACTSRRSHPPPPSATARWP